MENKRQPKVSVIVPIYNVEKYIERCVRSLMEQTLDDIEYIFVNDATPDNSMGVLNRVINEYPERLPMIKIFNHEVNKGQSSARNLGIYKSTGKYLIFIDSDDVITKEAIEKMYSVAEKNVVDFSMCENWIYNIEEYESRGRLYVSNSLKANTIIKGKDILKTFVLGKWHNVVWNKLLLRSFIVNNGLYFPDGSKFEDELWSFKLAITAKSMVAIKEGLYIYYVKSGSTMSEGWQKRFDGLKSLLPLFKEYIYANHLETNMYVNYFFLIKCMSVMNAYKSLKYYDYNYFRNLIYFKLSSFKNTSLLTKKQVLAYIHFDLSPHFGFAYFKLLNIYFRLKHGKK